VESLANDDLAQRIETDGYAIVRDVFDKDEVAKLRKVLSEHFSRRGNRHNLGWTQPNAAIEVPGISWLYSLPKVVNLFRRALRIDDVVFTLHCDIHHSPLSGWHKDEGRGAYFTGDYFNAEDCKVYKMAVYLQDHFKTGDGLTIRRGSHRTSSYEAGEEISLDTRAGDVILFDVRITHVGQRADPIERQLMRVNRKLTGGNKNRNDIWLLTQLRRLYCLARGKRDRLSVFFTFGYPNHFTDTFSRTNMKRQHDQNRNAARAVPVPLKEAFDQAGVRIYSEAS
jgi:hypothetical protein